MGQIQRLNRILRHSELIGRSPRAIQVGIARHEARKLLSILEPGDGVVVNGTNYRVATALAAQGYRYGCNYRKDTVLLSDDAILAQRTYQSLPIVEVDSDPRMDVIGSGSTARDAESAACLQFLRNLREIVVQCRPMVEARQNQWKAQLRAERGIRVTPRELGG